MAPSSPNNVEPTGGSPQTYADFYRQGWALHAAGKQEAAETNLRNAIELEPNSVDAYYTLGLALKAQDRRRDAVEAFRKVLSLIEAGEIENNVRAEMIRRLALGHINQVERGDWNLEGEIWQRKDSPTENV